MGKDNFHTAPLTSSSRSRCLRNLPLVSRRKRMPHSARPKTSCVPPKICALTSLPWALTTSVPPVSIVPLASAARLHGLHAGEDRHAASQPVISQAAAGERAPRSVPPALTFSVPLRRIVVGSASPPESKICVPPDETTASTAVPPDATSTTAPLLIEIPDPALLTGPTSKIAPAF